MKTKEDVLKYMESNIDGFTDKNLEGVLRVFETLSPKDPYYEGIKTFIENIKLSKRLTLNG